MPPTTLQRSALVLVAAAACAGTLASASGSHPAQPLTPTVRPAGGLTVVDASGRPVPNAVATLDDGGTERSDLSGHLPLQGRAGDVVTLRAPGFLPRAVTVDESGPSVVLAPATDAVSLRFGGDVMFGRRFYAAADGAPALLRDGADGHQHAQLLKRVQPLLGDADITAVNLESVLVPDPRTAPEGRRDARFHPTKNIIVASAPEAAAGLKEAGVDVVNLGNNHVYDALQGGITQTIAALDAAGLPHYGAGRTLDEAWRPAVLSVRGQKVAFIGCTTQTGASLAPSYVATATKGGAAPCTGDRLVQEVRAQRAAGATVVVSVHGGTEYVREQSPVVQRLSSQALAAGAVAVVNSHPHVVGTVRTEGSGLVAESLGNLLFDQDLWSTQPSYLLRVEISRGRLLGRAVDPVVIDGHVPVPASGTLAAASRAFAAGDDPDDALFSTGGFEATARAEDHAPLWTLGRYARVTRDAACSGSRGLKMERSPLSEADVVATPDHRVGVVPGERYVVGAAVRFASPGATLEVRWYAGMDGASSGSEVIEVPEQSRTRADGCHPVARAVTVPAGVHAAQVFVRLAAPADVQLSSEVSLDDVHMSRRA